MKRLTSKLLTTWILACALPVLGEYGVDVSWPMQYVELRSHPDFAGQQKKYDDFMNGCRTFYKDDVARCNLWETERTVMNLRQPQSVVVSHT